MTISISGWVLYDYDASERLQSEPPATSEMILAEGAQILVEGTDWSLTAHRGYNPDPDLPPWAPTVDDVPGYAAWTSDRLAGWPIAAAVETVLRRLGDSEAHCPGPVKWQAAKLILVSMVQLRHERAALGRLAVDHALSSGAAALLADWTDPPYAYAGET